MDKKQTRQVSGCLIVVLGFAITLTSIGVILDIAIFGNISKSFIDNDGESNLGAYRLQFLVLIIAIITLLLSGGKLSNLRIWENFPYEEEEGNDTQK